MRILIYLLIPLVGVLASLNMDKDLQYRCYYQILKKYSTKPYYDDDDDLNQRHDTQFQSSVTEAHAGRVRREIIHSQDTSDRHNAISSGAKYNNSIAPTIQSLAYEYRITEPTYFVVASRTLRPGFIYKVSVSVLQAPQPIKVFANITCDSVHLSGYSVDIHAGSMETLLLHIAQSSQPRKRCKLRLEGFFLNVYCDLAFLHELPLEYTQRSLQKIFIQVNKPLYMQGDVVHIRVYVISAHLNQTDNLIDIEIIDSNQHTRQRWHKRLNETGTISLEYKLTDKPCFGEWTINVRIGSQDQYKQMHFTVEEFYPSQFEVNINMPAALFTTSTFINGKVTATYSNGIAVRGNLTLEAIMRPFGYFDAKALNRHYRLRTFSNINRDAFSIEVTGGGLVNVTDSLHYTSYTIAKRSTSDASFFYGNDTSYGLIAVQVVSPFVGVYKFKWPKQEFLLQHRNETGFELLVIARVHNEFSNETYTGYAMTQVHPPTVRVTFLGGSAQVFKPSMPFNVFVVVDYIDGSALDAGLLKESIMVVSGVLEISTGTKHLWPERRLRMLHHRAGIWEVKINLISDLEAHSKQELRQLLIGATQMRLQASFTAASETTAYAELLLVANYAPQNQDIKVVTSTDMPTVVGEYAIFEITNNCYLDHFEYMMVSQDVVLANERETFNDGIRTIALVISADMMPLCTIVVWSLTPQGNVVADSLTFPVSVSTRINLTIGIDKDETLLNNMLALTISGAPGACVGIAATNIAELHRTYVKNAWSTSINSEIPSHTHLWHSHKRPFEDYFSFATSANSIDANRTFALNGLLVITDGKVPTLLNDHCGWHSGFTPCLTDGCYLSKNKCDGFLDCVDGSDELGCQHIIKNDMLDFDMYRVNRLMRHYESTWLWQDVILDSRGRYKLYSKQLPMPSTRLMLSASSASTITGFTTDFKDLEYKIRSMLHVHVNMPSQCRCYEHVSVQLTLFNAATTSTSVTINLQKSNSYRSVRMGSDRKSTRQNFAITLSPQDRHVVNVPIMPITTGQIQVLLYVKSEFDSYNISSQLNVAEVELREHSQQTLFLDLSKYNYIVENINVTSELQLLRFGRTRFSIVNNAVGHVLAAVPLKATWSNSFVDTADEHAFAFAISLYSLKYSRMTIRRNGKTERKILDSLNTSYQRLLSYMRPDGSFTLFRNDVNSVSSVWLTAHCLRIFQDATLYHKLTDHVWIDSNVIEALNWLLAQQTPEGSFYEPSAVTNADLHKNNITMTSHVLITLAILRNKKTNKLWARADQSRRHAQNWIEQNIQYLKHTRHPYDVAITTYALLLLKSTLAEDALSILRSLAHTSDIYTHWGSIDNAGHKVRYSSLHNYNSLNIETTAYALLSYVLCHDENMVSVARWLHANRLHETGWASTRDTSMALRALVEFDAYAAPSPSAVSIALEASTHVGQTKKWFLNATHPTEFEIIEVYDSFDMFKIHAKGNGFAVLQFHTEELFEAVIPRPHVPAFLLNNNVTFHGNHCSQVSYSTCVRWSNTVVAERSGLAILDITLPTGYGISQQSLDAYVLSQRDSHVIRAKFSDGGILFVFGYIAQEVCVEFTVNRWYPVANMTRYLPVRIYDYNAPEHFADAIVDAFPLQQLKICDVCGSSMCENCLSSNFASRSMYSISIILVTIAFSFSHF